MRSALPLPLRRKRPREEKQPRKEPRTLRTPKPQSDGWLQRSLFSGQMYSFRARKHIVELRGARPVITIGVGPGVSTVRPGRSWPA